MYSSIKNKNRADGPIDDDNISDGVNDANSQKNYDQQPLPDNVQTPEKQELTPALLQQSEDANINLNSSRPLLPENPPQNYIPPVASIPENQSPALVESKPEDVKIEIKRENNKPSDLGVPLTNVLLPSQFSQSASAEKLLVQLTWKNVTIKVNEVKRVHFKKVSNSKVILENLSGTVYPGQFLAILGSTGAGKTTLLNFLSGKMFSPNLIKQGDVFLNGVPRDKIDYPKFTAFVQQDDVFMECLTIEECLSFTARCKCPGTDALLKKRVDDLMEELSLTSIKDQRIGGKVTK
jgi:ABC-type multidrug transport system fused ATPase/permease subunit